MTHIIADPCIGHKNGDCIEVCPVDAIHPRRDEADWGTATQLFIDPETCIDCEACEPACPVEAIFTELRLPTQWAAAIQRNADHFSTQSQATEDPEPTP